MQTVCLCECDEGASMYLGLMAGYGQADEIVVRILKLSTDRIVKIFIVFNEGTLLLAKKFKK